MRNLTARRALGWSLGGVGALIGGEMILSTLDEPMATRILSLLPMGLVPQASARTSMPPFPVFAPFALYGVLALLLLGFTIAHFKSYATET
jgi:hypothetical protein